MTELRHDQILVELWPSVAEIAASRVDNEYKGRLTEFYDSVDSLLHTFRSSNLPVEAFTDHRLHKGEAVTRAFSPEIVELAACLGSSGVALALYKALRLWVDYKNGRRIKIVDGSLELEATQLTQDQFVELLETLRRGRETLANPMELKEALAQKGINAVSVDSSERLEKRCVLKNAARSSADSADSEGNRHSREEDGGTE